MAEKIAPLAPIDETQAPYGNVSGDLLTSIINGLGGAIAGFVRGPGDVMAGKRSPYEVGPEMALNMIGVGGPAAMVQGRNALGAAGGKLFNFDPHIAALDQTISDLKASIPPKPMPTKGPIPTSTEDLIAALGKILDDAKPADALAPSPPVGKPQDFGLSFGYNVKAMPMADGTYMYHVVDPQNKSLMAFDTLGKADNWFSENVKALVPEQFPATLLNEAPTKKSPFDQGISLEKWQEKNPGGSINAYYGLPEPAKSLKITTAPNQDWAPWVDKEMKVPPGEPGPKLEPKIVDLEDAARLARAENAGYTTDAYHGSRSLNTNSAIYGREAQEGVPLQGDEFYSTANPVLAEQYANMLHTDPNKGYHAAQNAGITPLKLNTQDYHVVDAQGKHWTNINSKAISEARAQGKPGVTIHNVWDEYASTKNLPTPNTIHITLPEGFHTVRSPIAQFKDLNINDLLAGLAGAGVILPQVLPDDKAK